jgi:antitoxin component YwqK of YwqJK toxin-antitoxin module
MAKRPKPVREVANYADGTAKFTGFRLDGELHGGWEWFRTDGSLMRTGSFDRGKQVGPWRTFDRSGRMVKETGFG